MKKLSAQSVDTDVQKVVILSDGMETDVKEYPNPWVYRGVPIKSEEIVKYIGIVYIITDTENGRMYIGKKQIWNMRKVKDKTRRQKQESNWQSYYSSHKEIKQWGKENPLRFKREILHLCSTKGMMNFKEIEEQFIRKVLYDDQYYNDQINRQMV